MNEPKPIESEPRGGNCVPSPCSADGDAGAIALLRCLPTRELEAAYRLAKADETDKGQHSARLIGRELIRRASPPNAPVRSNRIVGLRDQWSPNMTMRGWMRWQENRWKMHDQQVAWIRDQKAYAAQSNADISDHADSGHGA